MAWNQGEWETHPAQAVFSRVGEPTEEGIRAPLAGGDGGRGEGQVVLLEIGLRDVSKRSTALSTSKGTRDCGRWQWQAVLLSRTESLKDWAQQLVGREQGIEKKGLTVREHTFRSPEKILTTA